MLVQALDQPDQLANDPLGALLRFREAVPPKRGAFWLASSVGFLSFTVFGFCLSLAPGYFAQIVHADSRRRR